MEPWGAPAQPAAFEIPGPGHRSTTESWGEEVIRVKSMVRMEDRHDAEVFVRARQTPAAGGIRDPTKRFWLGFFVSRTRFFDKPGLTGQDFSCPAHEFLEGTIPYA